MVKLSELCSEYIHLDHLKEDFVINGVTANSKNVSKNFIFFAINGEKFDGADFIPEVLKKGCKVVFVGHENISNYKKSDCIFLKTKNIRKTYALVSSKFYKIKPEFLVGVTGTNGKTSVAWFTNQLWTLLGKRSAFIGTLGVKYREKTKINNLTTPDPSELHKNLKNLKKNKINNVIIEASSHGLSQYRLDGINFSISALSSFSRDHLDYHKTYKNYLEAKLKLFSEYTKKGGTAVINLNTRFADQFIAAASKSDLKIVTIGSDKNADWQYNITSVKNNYQYLDIRHNGTKSSVKTKLVGDFQVSNLLISIVIAVESGIKRKLLEKKINHITSPPGRLEQVNINQRKKIFIDYAHTPDALKHALRVLRQHACKRLVLIFGCGGNRDKGKRPLMGLIAKKFADKTIITDDNPRDENPKIIRSQIISQCPDAMEIPDRKEAILTGIKNLEDDDILLIAGKGHETTQDMGKNTDFLNDKEVVKNIIKKGLLDEV